MLKFSIPLLSSPLIHPLCMSNTAKNYNPAYLRCSNKWNHYLRENLETLVIHSNSSFEDSTGLHCRQFWV